MVSWLLLFSSLVVVEADFSHNNDCCLYSAFIFHLIYIHILCVNYFICFVFSSSFFYLLFILATLFYFSIFFPFTHSYFILFFFKIKKSIYSVITCTVVISFVNSAHSFFEERIMAENRPQRMTLEDYSSPIIPQYFTSIARPEVQTANFSYPYLWR